MRPRDGVAPERAETLYLLLSGLFLGALVITNVIAGKLFVLFGKPLSCGIIAYPVTFLVTDLISELYGRERATQLVKVGFVVSLFVTAVVITSTLAPAAGETYVDQHSFQRVFGLTPGIVFGSMTAYLIAQYVDVQLFEWWRERTGGRHLWLRNNGSTVFSQLVDTVVVASVTLAVWPVLDGDPTTAPISTSVLVEVVVASYVFKAVVALLDTPLFYDGTALLGRWIATAEPAASAPSGAASSEPKT